MQSRSGLVRVEIDRPEDRLIAGTKRKVAASRSWRFSLDLVRVQPGELPQPRRTTQDRDQPFDQYRPRRFWRILDVVRGEDPVEASDAGPQHRRVDVVYCIECSSSSGLT